MIKKSKNSDSRMKGSDSIGDDKIGKLSGGYINHALSGSRGSLDLVHTNGSQSLQNSHRAHREIQGSSDFICNYINIFYIKLKHY